MQTPVPAATTTPAQPQAFQSARAGAFPPQPLIQPTVATPTVHRPTNQGFGFAAINNGQASAAQTAFPEVAPRTYPGIVAWGSQQSASQMPVQQAGQLQSPPRTIVQPASQPLPPPTPLTTTVSSPPVPFLQ